MGSTNLLTLWTPNMAVGGCDFAFVPASGKMLRVKEFKALFDSDIDKALKTGDPATTNPLRVCFFLTYGLPHDAWVGTHTALPEDGVDGWVMDSNNPIESVQEYKRWWHAATGRAIIEFCFLSPFDVAAKADSRQVRIGGTICTAVSTPYESIGIELLLRSTHNERIEVWQERQEAYKRNDGSAMDVARMACVFEWLNLGVPS